MLDETALLSSPETATPSAVTTPTQRQENILLTRRINPAILAHNNHLYNMRRGSLEKLDPADIQLDNYGTYRDAEVLLVQEQEKQKDYLFKDGLRKIDYILVYTLSHGEANGEKVTPKVRAIRTYLKNLREKAHLDVEEEITQLKSELIVYVKVHVPFEVLGEMAEDMGVRMPLEVQPELEKNWSEKFFETLHIPNILTNDVPNKPLDYFTCPFRRAKADNYHGEESKAEIGLGRLEEQGFVNASFPLHDGPYKPPKNIPPQFWNKREILYEYWARWGCWYKYQPLSHIREYFGEKIAIYFAWLGFYTAWLLPTAAVGLLVFLYGLATMHTNTAQKEVCAANHITMCPLCNVCPFWKLSGTCEMYAMTYLFDNPATLFFAVFTAIWSVTFLEFWKRTNATLAYQWDCMGFQEEEERPRPEYQARAVSTRRNPITKKEEPHFPERDRIPRLLTGLAVVTIMIIVVIIFIIGVIIYRLLIAIPLTHMRNVLISKNAQMVANASGAALNLLIIVVMGQIYQGVARKLTEWEMHRTQSEFEDQFTFKVFIFEFFNFYSSIIYVAFFKGKFVGYPGQYVKIFGLRNESCGQGGSCMMELAIQMIVIMIGKQAISNVKELLLPKIKSAWAKFRIGYKSTSSDSMKPAWEQDYELCENEGLFEEYLEMIIQFGFITIFVAAFPLAPVFALLNNWIEIRLDARKQVVETKRPVAEKAESIGVWFTILEVICQLAVISNAFLIAFTSDFLPKTLYYYDNNYSMSGFINFSLAQSPPGSLNESCRYQDYRDINGKHTFFYWRLMSIKLAFIIIFEHVVFALSKAIDLLIPDIPENLNLKIKRERYLAKQALADKKDN